MENSAVLRHGSLGAAGDATHGNHALKGAEGAQASFDAQSYHEMTRLIERMHRRFLDVLRAELGRLEINDINAVQCLLLSNIGDEEINVLGKQTP